ncbi:MAG: EscU/YscU/HrcU family type III secretion system export apparatus switch protein [Chromatiales bacterium]|jgi:flagellar biosynthesis protein
MNDDPKQPPRTPKRKLAVALDYDGTGAPRVSAKGSGATAQEILEIAHRHDVPLRYDEDLVELLATVPLGEEIPEPLYVAVAEVLAFAYYLSGRMPPRPVKIRTDTETGDPGQA